MGDGKKPAPHYGYRMSHCRLCGKVIFIPNVNGVHFKRKYYCDDCAKKLK